MSDPESKGFKVVDKRGRADEDREPPAAVPPPPPASPGETGNRPGAGGVEGKKRPEDAASAVGGPAFLDLVGTLQFGAMAHLGMIQAPDGKRSPVNLPAAKDSIDLLVILQEKTKGNLTEEENEVLGEGLYHLRMAYLAVMKAGQGAGGKET
ncbi:MAG: DUF1844 domain-containing protein [Deltaproteobacteria bacterium]|nr:DUF1844 domain-containing protein [Deltaproteobacteria bacterium]PWB67086.1 MAG: hypothetical protein C3F14_03115 [Deltaproteobacteria bacterium]